MKKSKRAGKKESFHIIISSGTDCRKKPVALHLKKKSLLSLIIVVIVFITACVGASIYFLSSAAQYTKEINALKNGLETQSDQLKQYTEEMDSLQQNAPSASPGASMQGEGKQAGSASPAAGNGNS